MYNEIDTKVLSIKNLDRKIEDQLRRASNSIILNIAEGSSRFSKADRKNFFFISRGSAFECSSALDAVAIKFKIKFPEIESELEEISKMLYKMISNLNKPPLEK